MKRAYLFTLIFVFSCLYVSSQNLGDIKLNKNFSATLQFPFAIKFIVFGNNPQISFNEDAQMPVFKYYQQFIDSNTVIFRSNDTQSPVTSLTIKLVNGQIFTGQILYSENITQSFYDFSNENITAKKEIKLNDSIDNSKKTVLERVRTVINGESKYSHLGAIANGIVFQVANIVNDNKYTYYKIIINNKTASDYTIDGIYFRYDDKMKKKLKKKEIKNENRLYPFSEIVPLKVSAYTQEILGYAIPLFAITDRGVLIIRFVEKNGSRNQEIIVKASDLKNINVFKDIK